MNGILVLTLCNIYNTICIAQPINDVRIQNLDCPTVASEFNVESRKEKGDLVYFASCVPEGEFPKEYFMKSTASIEQ